MGEKMGKTEKRTTQSKGKHQQQTARRISSLRGASIVLLFAVATGSSLLSHAELTQRSRRAKYV